MPGLVPGIHVAPSMPYDVDGRDKPGHDGVETGERKTAIVERESSAPQAGGGESGGIDVIHSQAGSYSDPF